METAQAILEQVDDGAGTLEEVLNLAPAAMEKALDIAWHGATSTQSQLVGLSDLYVTVDMVLSSHGQATGAHSRLRYWVVLNAYATTLTVSQILTSYTLGSVLLRELIDCLDTMIDGCDMIKTILALEEYDRTQPSGNA